MYISIELRHNKAPTEIGLPVRLPTCHNRALYFIAHLLGFVFLNYSCTLKPFFLDL